MCQIAFVSGNTIYYWNSIILAAAVLTGLVFFWAAYLRTGLGLIEAAVACPMAILLSLFLGRLIHWYFLPDRYDGLMDAVCHFTGTGYALSGAFAGCFLTAVLLRLLKIGSNLPLMLDCMSIGGCAAIALGRLGGFFTAEDRGEILTRFTSLPWAYPVVNEISGLPEYRFATFLFQAVIAGGIAIILIFLFFLGKDRGKIRNGDITLLFLLGYCASQIVLDSTRYDALRLRVNGFISAVQVFSAITLALVIGILILRQRKQTGKVLPCVLGGVVSGLAFGGAAYLEYYVQRHGDQALGAYLAMGGCMAVVVIVGVILWQRTSGADDKRSIPRRGAYQGKFARN